MRQRLINPGIIFISFGTAWVYKLKSSGLTVANCQKLNSEFFERNLLDLSDAVVKWSQIVEELNSINSQLKWVFTVSPVRHLRDNFRENQLSKSILHLLTDNISKYKNCEYFPSYEIMMDDLRDYRFYNDDMTHPNKQATEYIFEKFIQSSYTDSSKDYFCQASKIYTMKNHKILDPTSEESRKFMDSLAKKIADFKSKNPKSLIN
jgi:hypothetical protein